MMAYRSGVPVVPVCIQLKKQKYAPFRVTHLYIGEPILYPFPAEAPGKRVYEDATKTYFRAVCALGGYPPPALPEWETPCDK